MEYQQEITLDLNTRSAPPVIYGAKQGDANTRILKINLLQNGSVYQFTGNELVVLRARKPDNTDIGNAGQINLEGNSVYVTLTEQMLIVPGRVLTDLLLYSNTNEFISTVSFIIDVQPAPVQVMSGTVSASEYAIFSQLLADVSGVPSLVNAAQAAMLSAIAASNSANAAASSAWDAVNDINDNGIIITTGTVLDPGTSSGIIEKTNKNTFDFHAPTVKPTATASINIESILPSEANVVVTVESATPTTGQDPNLLAKFNFDFTLPSPAVSLTTAIGSDGAGAAADASAVRDAIALATEQIPMENITFASTDILDAEHGGTGIAASNINDIRNGINAQQKITTTIGMLASNGWENLSQDIPMPSGFNSNSNFIASPANASSWEFAQDAELGFPSQSNNTLTFSCKSSPIGNIYVTIYWW